MKRYVVMNNIQNERQLAIPTLLTFIYHLHLHLHLPSSIEFTFSKPTTKSQLLLLLQTFIYFSVVTRSLFSIPELGYGSLASVNMYLELELMRQIYL
ncbi:hypothetical protein VNO78_22432 [Psophocarpus tetragonolobus]|uniref:Uncharacterized protein n=1 Tax=Psophocarpus tetragonolobus TaxID=3891 RepID=A0AAN9XBW1_PSOTE